MLQGGRRLGAGGTGFRQRRWGRKGGGPSMVCLLRGRVQEARGGCSRLGASGAQRSAQAAAAVDRAQAGSVRARARARCRTVFISPCLVAENHQFMIHISDLCL